MRQAWALTGFLVCAASAAGAEPQGKADSAKGQSIVNKVCSACHGQDGNSPTAANPKLAGQIPEYVQKQLVNFKSAGGMAAGLSADDMRDVAAYFAAQAPKPGVARHPETIALGRKIWRGGDVAKGLPACAGCHGAAGAGLPAQYPRLAGQYPEYIETQLKAFRASERRNDANKMMQSIASKMSDPEIRAVADYIFGLR
jgi:cytochrome c553